MAAISLATLGFSAIQTLTFSVSIPGSKVVHFTLNGKPLTKIISKEAKVAIKISYFCPQKMGKITEIYNRNIYGVITTLIFHIVILLFLILSHLNITIQPKMDSIVLDLSQIDLKIPEPPKEKIMQPDAAAVSQQKAGATNTCPGRKERA